MVRILIWTLAVLTLLTIETNAQTPAKLKALSRREETQWINAVENYKSNDGASFLEVLQFVQRLRSREFRFGSIGVGYNGFTGLPDSVGIDYWIGLKRLRGDAYVDLGFDVQKTATGFDIKPGSSPLSLALQEGRDALLAAVDEEYAGECIDAETKRHIC